MLELGLRRLARVPDRFRMGGAVVLWLVVAVSIAAAQAPPDALPRKGQLGVRVAAVPDEIRPSLKLEPTGGVLVQLLVPGGSAEAGGLQPGDILLALQGRRIESVADFLTRASALSAGQTCELGLMRSGRRTTRSLLVHERPRDRGANFDVLYHSVVSGGARLRTIVTRPHAAGRHPVLFLIPGLGATTVDQPLSDPGAYSRILAEFAKDGWVTVRVDKPGIGDSEGGPDGETGFEAELDVLPADAPRRPTVRLRRRRAALRVRPQPGRRLCSHAGHRDPGQGVAVYGTVVKPWTGVSDREPAPAGGPGRDRSRHDRRPRAGHGGRRAGADDRPGRSLGAGPHAPGAAAES